MSLEVADFARLAWVQFWQVAIVALVVGLVARLVRRDRPRLAYALWMLVIVKALAPPVWSSPTGVFSWAPTFAASARSDALGESVEILAIAPSPSLVMENEAASGRAIDWSRLYFALFSVWGAGVAVCAAAALGKQIVCAALIRRSRLPADERCVSALKDLSRRLNVRRRVRLVVTSRPIGPAAFGWLRPSILLPESLTAGMPFERGRLILAHELIHIRRGDVFASRLQLLAQLIWWFNPLVWWASREAGRERERCCDEEVIAGLGCEPGLYARTLLDVLERKALRPLAALPGVRGLEVTLSRLESIMRYKKNDRRRASLPSALVFAVGALLLVPGATPSPRAVAFDEPKAETPKAESPPKATPTQAADSPADETQRRLARVERAVDRLLWSEIMVEKGYIGEEELEFAREDLRKAGAQSGSKQIQRTIHRVLWAEIMLAKGYITEEQFETERAPLRKLGSRSRPAARVAE